jgi:hypothetical protein
MQYVDGARKLHRIDCPIGAAVVPFDNLDYTGSTKAPERFRIKVLSSQLRLVERITHHVLNGLREGTQVVPTTANPENGLSCTGLAQTMPLVAYGCKLIVIPS